MALAKGGGTALTCDGRVVGLDGGKAALTPCDRFSSPESAKQQAAKEAVRCRRALEIAHAACEVESSACVVDAAGVVLNPWVLGLPSPTEKEGSAPRLRAFHRKLAQRREPSKTLAVDDAGRIAAASCDALALEMAFGRQCSVDSEGVVHGTSKHETARGDRLKKLHRKRAARSRAGVADEVFESTVVCVDDGGHIQECRYVDRSLGIVALAVEAC